MTVEHMAGISMHHPQMAAVGRHYGCQIVSCAQNHSLPRLGEATRTCDS
ncbi:hypothetical protein ACIO3R_15210 [Streptomyces sp. NPDC087428]